MPHKWFLHFILFGIANYLIRFVVGGVLFMGVKLNPEGFAFGFLLTATALVTAYCLLKFVIKPQSLGEGMAIALVWAGIALVLDILTAEPVVGVSASYLLTQPQAWTRLLAIVAVAPFTVKNPADSLT